MGDLPVGNRARIERHPGRPPRESDEIEQALLRGRPIQFLSLDQHDTPREPSGECFQVSAVIVDISTDDIGLRAIRIKPR